MKIPGTFNRRRFLTILGASAGLPLLPLGNPRAADAMTLCRWDGTVLGAEAALQLYHTDREAAAAAIRRCLDEIDRLERIFTLYRENSELARLNRDGVLSNPSHDLVLLLSASQRFGAMTNGAFDISVQPLWTTCADHFAHQPGDLAGPPTQTLAAARELVAYGDVEVHADRIVLRRKGMALTLNGIAQGYITDRIATLLRGAGFDRVLVELGEHRALGGHPSGEPWRIGIKNPRAPKRIVRSIDLENRALATSGGYGMPFSRDGRWHHLFDPASGRSANYFLSVTVLAPTATEADALSTALAVMPEERTRALIEHAGPKGTIAAIFVRPDGSVVSVSS